MHTVYSTLIDITVRKTFIYAATTSSSLNILQLFMAFSCFTVEKKKDFDYHVQRQRLIRSESKSCLLTSTFNTLQFDNHRVLSLNTSTF